MEVVHTDDVGVGQAAGDLCLVLESFEGFGVSQEVGKEDLDGDFLVADTVEGLENLAHAAGAHGERIS